MLIRTMYVLTEEQFPPVVFLNVAPRGVIMGKDEMGYILHFGKKVCL